VLPIALIYTTMPQLDGIGFVAV